MQRDLLEEILAIGRSKGVGVNHLEQDDLVPLQPVAKCSVSFPFQHRVPLSLLVEGKGRFLTAARGAPAAATYGREIARSRHAGCVMCGRAVQIGERAGAPLRIATDRYLSCLPRGRGWSRSDLTDAGAVNLERIQLAERVSLQ